MYAGLLVARDGDWVVDYESDTVEEVQNKLADQGSRWYFYPFHAVIKAQAHIYTGRGRIIDAAPPFEHMKGKSIKTLVAMISDLSDDEIEGVLSA